MTEVVGIQKENVGDRKWLFIICCIIIILILTSAILWINSQQTEPEQFQPTPPAGSEIYSKFGFSFFYPEDMYVFETGLMDGDNPNADSGSVVGTLQKSKNQAFTLQWMKSEPVD